MTCLCTAEDADFRLLDRLVNDFGVDQVTASRVVWHHNPTPTATPARPLADQVRDYVRASFAMRFPWLRLPTTHMPSPSHPIVEQESTPWSG